MYLVDEVLKQYQINLRDDKYRLERAKILLDAEVCKTGLQQG